MIVPAADSKCRRLHDGFESTSHSPDLRQEGHLAGIPPIRTPLEGLFITTTAQIHSQDRSMDEGIKAGYSVADVVSKDMNLLQSRADCGRLLQLTRSEGLRTNS
jgi:hypothetical protein